MARVGTALTSAWMGTTALALRAVDSSPSSIPTSSWNKISSSSSISCSGLAPKVAPLVQHASLASMMKHIPARNKAHVHIKLVVHCFFFNTLQVVITVVRTRPPLPIAPQQRLFSKSANDNAHPDAMTLHQRMRGDAGDLSSAGSATHTLHRRHCTTTQTQRQNTCMHPNRSTHGCRQHGSHCTGKRDRGKPG